MHGVHHSTVESRHYASPRDVALPLFYQTEFAHRQTSHPYPKVARSLAS